jgi:hypothetical protein
MANLRPEAQRGVVLRAAPRAERVVLDAAQETLEPRLAARDYAQKQDRLDQYERRAQREHHDQ